MTTTLFASVIRNCESSKLVWRAVMNGSQRLSSTTSSSSSIHSTLFAPLNKNNTQPRSNNWTRKVDVQSLRNLAMAKTATELTEVPKQNYDYFLVLDFEATCDRIRTVQPQTMKHRHRPASLDSFKFVNEIKKFPALYDPSDSEYRNMEHKNAAWRAISAVIQMPVRDCQLRWKSLRDRFVREKKSYKQDPSNKVTWPLYHQLAFLTNYISHKSRRKSEYNSEADLTDEDDDGNAGGAETSSALRAPTKHEDDSSAEMHEIAYNSLEVDCQSSENGSTGELGVRVGDISIGPLSSLPHSKKSAAASPRTTGRKRPFDEVKVTELLTKLVNRPEPDEDELFFMSAAKMFKRVPVEKRSSLKLKIMEMISSEELT